MDDFVDYKRDSITLSFNNRWFCHFDDDIYANIPVLIEALREAVNKSEDGGVYFGRWPKENVPGLPHGMPVSFKITLNAPSAG